jgi:hypothetical protein
LRVLPQLFVRILGDALELRPLGLVWGEHSKQTCQPAPAAGHEIALRIAKGRKISVGGGSERSRLDFFAQLVSANPGHSDRIVGIQQCANPEARTRSSERRREGARHPSLLLETESSEDRGDQQLVALLPACAVVTKVRWPKRRSRLTGLHVEDETQSVHHVGLASVVFPY